MDRFSLLSDELLIKILSFLPTKVAVSTSILSKRWEYLWMWLPKLQFGCRNSRSSECKRLQRFLDRNLLLHRAPVIESLNFQLNRRNFIPDSIKLWIGVAICHSLRELEVFYAPSKHCRLFYAPDKHDILPRNLFTCKSLVILKLDGRILLDVPRMVFLPSLKTLRLKSTRYFNEESLRQLLSNCPILEDLLVELHDGLKGHENEVMGELTVVSQSLQRLSLHIPSHYDIGGIVINTPSLKYFKLKDHNMKNHYCLIENMPNLIEADVVVDLPNIHSFIGSLTSVKHLAICSKAVYGEGFVFNQLRNLQLCKCNWHSSDLFVRLLKDSPHLQELEIVEMNGHIFHELIDWEVWNQPSTIPECVLSTLQTFNWEGYRGVPGERCVAVYMLKNASHLRTSTIKYLEFYNLAPKSEIIGELEHAFSLRASTTCQLVLGESYDYY